MLVAIVSGFVLSLFAPWLTRFLGRWAGWVFSLLPLLITLYFARFIPSVFGGDTFRTTEPWIPSLGIQLSFYLDDLSLVFTLLIAGIGALILIYSGGYLKGHALLGRFYAYLLSFMASMLGLVLADHVVTLFVFWELTSFTSYLLIGFDHKREEARRAALQALLVTGVGGLALLAGLLVMGIAGGGFELSALLEKGEVLKGHPLYLVILLLVLIGAFTKSAQFPFHFWLPNAMVAPTPVSAYLHSSTMVKAGIYLLARLFPVLGGTPEWQGALVAVGCITLVTSTLLMLRRTEFKPILAYTTIGVLAFLTVLLGWGTDTALKAAAILLVAHALYKGALFLVAGAIDRGTGEKDTEQVGGLFKPMPLTAACGVLAAFSMMGLPPFLGFMAKELLYESLWEWGPHALLLKTIFLFSGMGMVLAAWVCGIRPFLGREGRTLAHPHEAPSLWVGPLVLSVEGAALAFIMSPTGAWHGFTPPLAAGVTAIAGGLGLTCVRQAVRRLLNGFAFLYRLGPESWYDMKLRLLDGFASFQTRILQSGYLRRYLIFTLATLLVSVGYYLWVRNIVYWPDVFSGASLYEAGLSAIIVSAAIFAVGTGSRFGAVTSLGVVGYGVALLFLHLGAPDIAMTQMVVDAISVILFILVLYHLPRYRLSSSHGTRVRDGLLSLGVGGLVTLLVAIATRFPLDQTLTSFFARESLPAAHGRNVVNVIIVDFRGFDTLGEITVLVIAGLGIFGMLKLRLLGRGEGDASRSEASAQEDT
ncbi:MAG: DUF4040 domain-containing protein [Candidatus Omnitrophica bacterium]|nr:DUF4040 domain-containing protein [Candidatus Omnitrophota bacterium]